MELVHEALEEAEAEEIERAEEGVVKRALAKAHTKVGACLRPWACGRAGC